MVSESRIAPVGARQATWNFLVSLSTDPPGATTVIGPVTAPGGTVAVILVREFAVKEALTPPNWTAVAPVNPNPVMVTEVPTGPLVGLNEPSAGTGRGTGPLIVNRAMPDT